MRRRKALHVALVMSVFLSVLPAVPAAGGESSGGDTSALQETLTELFGLDADQAAMFAESLNPVGDDFDAFGWGGDATVPATLSEDQAPWSTPTAVGLNFINFQDPSSLPDLSSPFGGAVMGTVGGELVGGDTYMVATALMADEIPVEAGNFNSFRQSAGGGAPMLFKQFDFPLLVLGMLPWLGFSQFPDDTWKLATFVMSLAYGPTPWSLAFYTFGEDGQNVISGSFPGFFLVYGNLIMVAVLASAVFGPLFNGSSIGVRFAGDIKDAPTNPALSRVVRAPAGPPSEASFFPSYGHTVVPGLDGRFDPYEIQPIVGPDGYFWFDVTPRTPWAFLPPSGIFSYFIQAGFHGDPEFPDQPNQWFGFQEHAGTPEVFGSGPDGPLTGGEAYVQNDGSLLFRTPWLYGGEPTTVTFDGGTLTTEDSPFKSNSLRIDLDPASVAHEDEPTRFGGSYPVYDLITGEVIAPPPETTTTTTTTTTQPAAATETTAAITTVTPRPTTTERTLATETCWWCWGAVLLFLVVLLAILYIWLKSYDWWTCWLPWFIVIFVWVPFVLAGLWWWRPAWWWVPLLAWFPVVAGYTWYWARDRSWWQPWHLYVVGGYLAVLAIAMLIVGAPEWGLLLPLFWVPWVAFYLWFRGSRQPWFQPWMWGLSALYLAWIFVWVIALTPWWAWWLPVVFFPAVGWWFVTHGYDWEVIHGPKWCWVIPFSFLPFLAWWIPLWGPWWCFVIIGILALTLLCAIFNHFKEEEWWSCWLPWFLVIWVGIPFLLAGLWFFGPNWWWLPLLGWFIVIPAHAYWWAQHRTWWQPRHWYVAGAYLAVAALLMLIVGSPTWGLLFPVFWLGPVAFYLWYRPRRQPWFQQWMWFLFGAYVAWIFIWVIWLTPFWGWWFPVFFAAFFGWWGLNQGYDDELWIRKTSVVLPMALLPWVGYMLAVYCIPEFYLSL